VRIGAKTDFKLIALRCLKTPVCDHRAIKLTQNYVCFFNTCINLLAPSSVTRKYHPKVLELLDLLQLSAASLQRTLAWVSGEKQYLGLFGVIFPSRLIARSWKSIKCMSKTLLRKCKQDQILRKKQTIDSAASNSDTLVGVQHPQWTVVILLRRHWLPSRNTVTWRPVTGGRWLRIPVTLRKAFPEGIWRRVKICLVCYGQDENHTGYILVTNKFN